VKGGGVEFDPQRGTWSSIGRDGAHPIKDPFRQGSDQKHAIIDFFKEDSRWKAIGGSRLLCGHAVFFPDVGRIERLKLPNAPKQIIGSLPDTKELSRWLASLFEQSAPGYTYTLDRYGNMTQTSEVRAVYSRLAYLREQEYPQTIPDGAPYYFARFEEQLAPEQGKYSAVLDLIPSDPTRFDELYEYVPTLRKSLRLSQEARCSPVFGSDYLIDDEGGGPPGLPQLFQIDYLGEKKILALEHAAPESFDAPGTPTQLDDHFYYHGGEGIIPFPKPAMGKWELRDSYVISLKRLPQFAKGYCYSERVMYVDKENYFEAGELDLYRVPGSLYKAQLLFLYLAGIPATGGDTAELLAGPNTGLLVDFQNRHLTVSPYLRSCVNSECAKDGYLDMTRYASPEGLMKIVQ
jgi:hypothetical protein